MNEALDREVDGTLAEEQFENPVESQFICNICFQVVDADFFDCSECDNLFCSGCVQKDRVMRNKTGRCPVCRVGKFKCANRFVR